MTAVEVTNEVKINHWNLGKEFAEWNNEEQASFLHGMATGIENLGYSGHLQMSYIVKEVESFGDPYSGSVKDLIGLMHQYFAETKEVVA